MNINIISQIGGIEVINDSNNYKYSEQQQQQFTYNNEQEMEVVNQINRLKKTNLSKSKENTEPQLQKLTINYLVDSRNSILGFGGIFEDISIDENGKDYYKFLDHISKNDDEIRVIQNQIKERYHFKEYEDNIQQTQQQYICAPTTTIAIANPLSALYNALLDN